MLGGTCLIAIWEVPQRGPPPDLKGLTNAIVVRGSDRERPGRPPGAAVRQPLRGGLLLGVILLRSLGGGKVVIFKSWSYF